MRRRKILKSIGSASVGVSSAGLVSADATSDDTDEVEVEIFRGRNRRRVVTDAFSDPAFRDIVRNVHSRGWKISIEQIEARRVNYKNGGKYEFIVAEAERTGTSPQTVKDEEMILIWIGNDTSGLELPQHTVAHHVRKTPSSNIADKQSRGLLGWDEITVIKSEDGTIREFERNFHNDEVPSQTDSVEPDPDPGDGGGDGCCRVDVEIGQDAKWGCTALAIVSAGLSGWTCGACFIDPSRATCALCVIGAAASGISTAHCFSSTVTIQEDVERSWLYDNDYLCLDFEPSNNKTLMVSESFYSEELPTC